MTSVRQGFLFSIENKFKGGNTTKKWIAPPPGSYFSNTSARGTTVIRGTGNKTWEVAASGAFGGSWDWTFMLDYDYLEPLMLVFDKLNGKKWTEEGYGAGTPVTEGDPSKGYTYTFTKNNDARIPSFCVRRKVLNRIAGGPSNSDELTELYGCVVQSISFARSASTSQIQVSMSGSYADEKMVLGALEATDYTPYDGHLMEYTCMLISTAESSIEGAEYVANTDTLSLSIQNNSGMINNLCNAFPESYYEGFVQFQLSTSVYSNNPEMYKTKVYAGGQEYPSNLTEGAYPKTFRPMSKGLIPLSRMYIATYDHAVTRDTRLSPSTSDIINAYKNSDRSFLITVEDAVLKSMKWQNGEGSKLVDALSSVDCRNMYLTIKTQNSSALKPGKSSADVVADTTT